MIYIKSLIKVLIVVCSFNALAAVENNEFELVEGYLSSVGYGIEKIDFNSNYIHNSYKIKLVDLRGDAERVTPKSKILILNNEKTEGVMVYGIQRDNIKKTSFEKMKSALTYFNKDYFSFLLFSLPIQINIENKFSNVDLFNSTMHSFLMPQYSNNVIWGEVIDFNDNEYVSKSASLKKERIENESATIKYIVEKYPDLILEDGRFNVEKSIVVLFSDSCYYCKKMVKDYKKYNEKGYSLIILPATELTYDIEYNQSTYQYFCATNINKNIYGEIKNKDCDLNNEKLNDIYGLKRDLLRGIEFKGTPTLYINEYNIWKSGYISYEGL